MKTFLEYLAEDLIQKHGKDLSRFAIVFPNKRAALFLNQAIAKAAKGLMWAPSYLTISDFFREQSDLTVADPIKSVCILHQVYKEIAQKDETLDEFYGWGQLLLADFDDIDKNMVDSEKLFGLLSAHKEMDNIDYLSLEQIEVLKKAFPNVVGNKDSLRRRYLEFWDKLFDIYKLFKERLEEKGLAYEGMLYRKVIEQGNLQLSYEKYVFVGFNVLQKVEQLLFTLLKEQDRALFYWDFDHYYLRADHEAGRFIRRWLNNSVGSFRNELNANDTAIYHNMAEKKDHVRFIASPTENLQARYITEWLRENNRYKNGKRTAIVLCDEHLLQTVIHCIPEEVDSLNVTTGYPLQQTLIASFITQLVKLQFEGYSVREKGFRLRYLNRVLRHPYAQYLWPDSKEILEEININRRFFYTWEGLPYYSHKDADMPAFVSWLVSVTRTIGINGRTELRESLRSGDQQRKSNDALFQESVFRMYTLLSKLQELMKPDESGYRYLDANFIIFRRLLSQLIDATSVPFHGEPVQGVQIMGVLETRNLDFDHVLLLSCNEGNMPKGINDSSFVLHNIRRDFGMTTIENKVSIFSYYFYRLIQRSKDVTILYNNSTQGGQTGEMSRFMLQLMVEWQHRASIEKLTLIAGQELKQQEEDYIPKDAKIISRLNQIEKFSPSAINVYRTCPAKYFYSYVVGLREEQDSDDDGIDNRMFGNIFHMAAQLLYEQLPKGAITAEELSKASKDNALLEDVVQKAFATELFGIDIETTNRKYSLNGLQLLNKEVIKKYLRLLLHTDMQVAPIEIIAHEFDVEDNISFMVGDKVYEKTIGGRIDRLDKATYSLGDNTSIRKLRVVDYKTGRSNADKITKLDDVFNNEKLHDHADYVMQSMLYSMLMAENKVLSEDKDRFNPHHLPVCPALLFIQHANRKDYSPIIVLDKEEVEITAEEAHNFQEIACDNASTETDEEKYKKVFRQELQKILSEIYDPAQPFLRSGDERSCGWCPFKFMCGK